MARLIDYNGVLAIDFGMITNWEKPQRERNLSVSNIRSSDWAHLLDCKVDFSGNQGRIWAAFATRPTFVDTTDWQRITIVEPVKKPRRGKRQGQRYDWEWSMGQWRRVWI